MNTLWCISWLIDHKVSAQQPTKDLVAVLRQLGVATQDEKAQNSHLSKWSVKQMVHEGGKELRESEGTHGIFADKDGLWEMKEIFSGGMPISIQGDGCLDSGLAKEEALLLRFIGKKWLQAVSICFQVDSVSVADVAQRVGFAINAIKKRATINGDIERAAHHITTGKGPWEQGSIQIVRCSAEERSEHS